MSWERRPPSELQMGNGTLLATFTADGELEQLFAPNIDAMQSRLGAFQTSLLIPSGEMAPPQMIRLRSDAFQVRLRLLPGTQVLQAEYQHRSSRIMLQRTLGMHPTEPVILDRWRIFEQNAGILHESIPWMGNTTSAQCSLYHPTFNGLVHHRGRRWLGVLLRGPTQWARVGHLNNHDRYRLWDGDIVDCPIGAYDFGAYPSGPIRVGWDHVVQGSATWGALAAGPATEIEMLIICAESELHLGKLLQLVERIPTQRYFELIESMVERRHAIARPYLEKIGNPTVVSACTRSIDVLHSLQDNATGALMAAAEVDPHSRLSGGYGYCWPRDGAYLADALGAFGYHERVEKFFKFATDTQDPSGAWWQRYLATGHAGPSWGRIQIDEPANVIISSAAHYMRTRDLFWLEKFWPTLDRGLHFLEKFNESGHPNEHVRGEPSHDLWEERTGIHAYSQAAVVQAFLAGAYLARELSDRNAQIRLLRRSRELRENLLQKFLPSGGAIRRAFIVSSWDYARGGGYWDEAADVSLLGTILPFHLFRKRDAISHRILEQVRSRLWSHPVGGVMRYERDTYRGGNPWILATLWRAMVELEFGYVNEARDCFQWALSKQTSLGMLAEQVHRESGHPFWVIPLGWSHAMMLIFVRQVLDRQRQAQIWGRI